jgi:hypothetical protein
MNMTMPNERRWAIENTRIFLSDLMDPKKTPRVPSAIRKEAYRCLKHYPGEYHMGEAAIQAPGIWGEQKEERKDGEWSKTIKDQLAHLKDNQQ